MLDFLAHAILLKSIWTRNLVALKTQEELFRTIPFGCLSFLILTVLTGWLYANMFKTDGNVKNCLPKWNRPLFILF